MKFRLNRSFFPWVFSHSFEFWYYYVFAMIALYILHRMQAEIPQLASELAKNHLNGHYEILTFLLLALGIMIFRTASRLLFFYPARVQQKLLRLEVVQILEKAWPKSYEQTSKGDLFQIIINDFNRLRAFVGFALLQVGNILIAGYVLIPKIRNFNEDFLIAFSPLIVCLFLFILLIYLFQPLVKRNLDEQADLQQYLIESYDGKKTIQNFKSESIFLRGFNFLSHRELATFFLSSVGRAVSLPLIKVGIGASLIWASLIIYKSQGGASDLIFFSGHLFLVLEPLMFLSWIGVVISQAYAAWKRIQNLLRNLNNEKFENHSIPIQENKELDVHSLIRINFDFHSKQQEVSLLLGNWNMLVGATASGKTTLLNHIADSLYDKKMVYVQQYPYLFSASLKENLFLDEEPSHERLHEAYELLKVFELHSLESDSQKLFDIELGENGKRLSGGQRKRVALVRSLLKNPDILIWDDPFSSVDVIVERDIIFYLKNHPLYQNKTFIFSGHRATLSQHAAHLIYLDKGSNHIQHLGSKDDIRSFVSEYFEKQLL